MRLVRNFLACAPNNVSSLLLFDLVKLLSAILVNADNLFLELLELLLESCKHAIKILFLTLVKIELAIELYNFSLVVDLLTLIQGLFEHDSISLVFQLSILRIVNG